MICPIMEERGTVWLDTLDTPAKSVKEHLSIVICGHDGSDKGTATRRILFEQGRIPEIELDELTQEAVRLEESPLRACFLHGGNQGCGVHLRYECVVVHQ